MEIGRPPSYLTPGHLWNKENFILSSTECTETGQVGVEGQRGWGEEFPLKTQPGALLS